MKIEIDQSGKVEATNKPTVVAFSNDKNRSVIIFSRDKKYLQKIFREAANPQIFVYKTFAVLIFFLIKDHLKKIQQIIIDREYIGYEKLIKQFILEMCQKYHLRIDPSIIHFRNIGKKSKAHNIAIDAYQKRKADTRITARDFLRVTFSNKKSGNA